MNGKFGIIKRQNIENITNAISELPWERRFINSAVNGKVHLFNKTIKNFISNYIPHKTIICNDRDHSRVN